MPGLPKSEVSTLPNLFDLLCDSEKAHSFSEPQFPYSLGLLLMASLLQQGTEWVGLWCCGNEGLGNSEPFLPPPGPLPFPLAEVAAPFCVFCWLFVPLPPPIGELGRGGAGCRRSLLRRSEVS